MSGHISRFDPEKEYYSSERCHILELHNVEDDPGCSVARARVEPGVTTRLHVLGRTIERYVILEGAGLIEVGGEAGAAVARFDVVNIPAGVSQRITNTGEADLVFLCICTPRYTDADYQDVEEPVGSE